MLRLVTKRYTYSVTFIIKLLCTMAFVCGFLCIAGCASQLQPEQLVTTAPTFDPITFWTGRTKSWGVVENRDGAPTAIVTTTTQSMPDDADGMHMVQHVVLHGKDTVRDWHMRRLGNGQFEATANDMVGKARGVASGRTFHWTWTLASHPGNPLLDVTMEQWMYLADNGTLMNRTIITKLGVRLAEISEQFERQE